MPSINLPAKVRFVLYIIGALASLGVMYAVEKAWAGDAEVRLVQGLVALIAILAAANTNTSGVQLRETDDGTYYDPSKGSKILGKAVMSDPRKQNGN